MNTFWQDLRYGARMMLKNRSFTAIAVLTLALGIGANTAIFSVVNAVLLNPLPFLASDRLMALGPGILSLSESKGVSSNSEAVSHLDRVKLRIPAPACNPALATAVDGSAGLREIDYD